MNIEFEIKQILDKNYVSWKETRGTVGIAELYSELGLNQTALGLEKTFKRTVEAWETLKESYPGLNIDLEDYHSAEFTVWNIVFEDGSNADPLRLYTGPGMNALVQAFGPTQIEKELTGYFGRTPYGFDYGKLESLFLS